MSFLTYLFQLFIVRFKCLTETSSTKVGSASILVRLLLDKNIYRLILAHTSIVGLIKLMAGHSGKFSTRASEFEFAGVVKMWFLFFQAFEKTTGSNTCTFEDEKSMELMWCSRLNTPVFSHPKKIKNNAVWEQLLSSVLSIYSFSGEKTCTIIY